MGIIFRIRKSLIYAICIAVHATMQGQQLVVKTNLAYAATTTPNLTIEIGLGKQNTLEVGGGLNVFTFPDNNKFKHWLFQPEYRWWFCERFYGHFIGVHAHLAQFNIGGWDIPLGRLAVFENNRYQGYLYGGGFSYGYQWIVHPRWNLEFNLGVGYARSYYEEYPCTTCGNKQSEGVYNYWGITKTALSFIYFIK